MTMLADKLKEKLLPLQPLRVVVSDDSDQHIGHAGNPDGKGETHFSLEITSAAFTGKSRVERQRMVMDLLQPLWQETTLHALSMRTFTPGEDKAKAPLA